MHCIDLTDRETKRTRVREGRKESLRRVERDDHMVALMSYQIRLIRSSPKPTSLQISLNHPNNLQASLITSTSTVLYRDGTLSTAFPATQCSPVSAAEEIRMRIRRPINCSPFHNTGTIWCLLGRFQQANVRTNAPCYVPTSAIWFHTRPVQQIVRVNMSISTSTWLRSAPSPWPRRSDARLSL
jgi:hypothetical protein